VSTLYPNAQKVKNVNIIHIKFLKVNKCQYLTQAG